MPDQVQGNTIKTRTGEVIPDHNLIFTDITAQVIMIHAEAAPGHDIGIITSIPGITHDAHTPHIEITAIDPAETHHSRDHSRSHSCPTYKSSRQDLHRSHSNSSKS